MATGDVSGCVEFSDTYFGFHRFDSGKYGINFDCTGDTQDVIFCKDPTADVTKAVLYLDYLRLGCGTTSAAILDGSDGTAIVRLRADSSVTAGGLADWDFGNDPMRCLTAESTQGICLSSGDGDVWGFIKVHWGAS